MKRKFIRIWRWAKRKALVIWIIVFSGLSIWNNIDNRNHVNDVNKARIEADHNINIARIQAERKINIARLRSCREGRTLLTNIILLSAQGRKQTPEERIQFNRFLALASPKNCK